MIRYTLQSCSKKGKIHHIRRYLNLKNLKIKKADPFAICKDPKFINETYDLTIIGGGSGGMKGANYANKIGLKTILFDYVHPSPQGSQWGVGGTCVNVGCVPKKLMHQSSILKYQLEAYKFFGHNLDLNTHEFDYATLIRNINLNTKVTNHDMSNGLQGPVVYYINAMATYQDPNTILYSPDFNQIKHFVETGEVLDEDKVGRIKTKYSCIAVGGRPIIPSEEECPGAKYAITSDDIFLREESPGKTLVVGAGFIGVECTSFLHKLGLEPTLLARTTMLRGFDEGVVKKMKEYMVDKFEYDIRENTILRSITKKEDGKLKCELASFETDELIGYEDYDNVLFSISRSPSTKYLNLERIGVKTSPRTGKVIGGNNGENELTNIENIYAIGDALEGAPMLTPVAGMLGKTVTTKVFNKVQSDEKAKLKVREVDFNFIPTTVFAFPEYSSCGLTEEKAKEIYGEDNIEIWLSVTTPIEEKLRTDYFEHDETPKRLKNYFKLVCKKDEERTVLGLHYVGYNAGEIMQGFGVSLNYLIKKGGNEEGNNKRRIGSLHWNSSNNC